MEIQLNKGRMTIQNTEPELNQDSGKWITLMDYAMKNGVSLSTLRRHIKAQKLTYKIEDGRYLLWDEDPSKKKKPPEDVHLLQSRLHRVTQDLKHAQEEIAELKTLIALYEEKIPQHRFNN